MADLEVFITNRSNTIHRRLFQYEDLEVEAAFNDSRLARLTAPIADYNALHQSNVGDMKPLRRMLKVTLRVQTGVGSQVRRPIFWGPILLPRFKFKQGKVEISAHDPSLWLKHHFLRFNDEIVTTDQPVNGTGAWVLVSAALPTPTEDGRGYPDPGIVQGELGNYATSLETKMDEGADVWSALQEFSQAGPDFDLEPIDETYDPDTSWAPGVMGRMNFYEQRGTDRSASVIFHFGWGRDNLEDFEYAPDGARVRNRYIAASECLYREARYDDGIVRDGMMDEWETLGGGQATEDVLAEHSSSNVKILGHPPDTFTITPRQESGPIGSRSGTPFRWPRDLAIGDTIRAIAKKDGMTVDEVGRVMKVITRQANPAGGVKQEMECVPLVLADADIDVGALA